MRNCSALTILVVFFAFVGCTRNNGNIGDIFGLWKVVSIDMESAEATEPSGLFMAFQNSTVLMRQIAEMHEYEESYGNWHINGDLLYLFFPDSVFPPLEAFGLPRECCLTIRYLNHKTMILSYKDDGNKQITYNFVKW